MKKILVLLLSLGTIFSSYAAPTTAERHANRGIACTSCHTASDKSQAPRQQECLSCHGASYQALAKRTEKVTPNPHFNHYGDRDCNTCHKGHSASQLSCDSCHKFQLKTP